MMTVEEFADHRRHSPNTLEGKMAFANRKAVEDIESASKKIWKYIRAKKVDGQLVPYFLPDAEGPLQEIDSAEKRLAEIQSDIKKFIKIMNGNTLRGLTEELHRAKVKISNTEHDSLI